MDQKHKEQRDIQYIVHHLLVFGVVLSAILMIAGLLLDFALHRPVPTALPPLGEVLQRVIAFRPSGLLAFGLLVLIATPIARVFASIVAFIYERDWRYVGVTTVVFLIVLTSILLGRG